MKKYLIFIALCISNSLFSDTSICSKYSNYLKDLKDNDMSLDTLKHSIVRIDGEKFSDVGIGFFFNKSGLILTNANHVVNQADSLLVDMPFFTKKKFKASVQAIDLTSDLAIIALDDQGFTDLKKEVGHITPLEFANCSYSEYVEYHGAYFLVKAPVTGFGTTIPYGVAFFLNLQITATIYN